MKTHFARIVRTDGGTQIHMTDEHGLTWCGLTPNRLKPVHPMPIRVLDEEGIQVVVGWTPAPSKWEDIPDHEKCHKCEVYRPRKMTFHRVVRGVVLPARQGGSRTHGLTGRARARRAFASPETKARPYSDGWGGAYEPPQPGSIPAKPSGP